MDCGSFEKLCGRLVDGEAPPDVSGEMREHALSCGRCGRLLEDLSLLSGLHAAVPELEMPEGLVDGIMRGIEQRGEGRTRWLRLVVPAAAAVFIAVGIWAGLHITRTLFGPAVVQHAEVTGLEYLDDYPPDSMGEAIDLAAKGGDGE